MRSFSVRVLANNQAGSWQSWPEKIAAIKAFYASRCELDITLTPTTLTPQFVPYEPSSGNGVVYRVDEEWYQANVLPLAQGADIVLFVVPPTDHPNVVTLMGLDYYQQSKVGEISLFVDETSHTYISQNGTDVDQGETAVVYARHEISHQFYGLLAKTDNTHLYFFAGTPEKVLADFDFDEQNLEWYTLLVQKLEQEVGLLKARQIPPVADPAPSQSQNSAPTAPESASPTQSTFPAQVLAWETVIAKEEGAKPEHHNPINLKFTTLTASWGATQGPAASDGGYLAIFKDDATGLFAACSFLVLGCENQLLDFHSPAARTLAGFTQIFAGNPPQQYIDAIVQAMGGDPNVQISTFLS